MLMLLMAASLSAQAPSTGRPKTPPGGEAGTRAPDGVGVLVADSPGAGPMSSGPWVEGSLLEPLKAGARMPTGSIVTTIDDKSFDLNAAVASKPTVLIFYRGGWCPYCNAHLRELQKSAPALQAMGYQLLAISTDTPAGLRKTLSEDQLSYQLLSDVSLAVATQFGLKYKVQQYYLDHLSKDHDTDLVQQNGGYLLTPGAFIMDTTGVVRFAYVNTNYAVRISQDALLQAAREALTSATK
jgi:peroxiredoxin